MLRQVHQLKNKSESGVALLFAIFALLLLSAIAASLVMMTNTESSVNTNYRAERVSSFAAKAGVEEARDRMVALSAAGKLPTAMPPAAGSVLYILNEGNAPGSVQPWTAGNAYMDDELCHDFAGIQAQQPAPDVRCTTPPSTAMLVAGTAVSPITSNYPWAGTSAALSYKWVRITLKQSNSVQLYPVNSNLPNQPVCYNGVSELALPAGTANCAAVNPNTTNPVYMITALAVSASGTTRRMVQTEVGLNPPQPFPYGLFATSTACPALQVNGGGNTDPATDSFTSANGGTYAGTQSDTLGDVGSNGGVALGGHAKIGGAVAVPSTLPSPPAVPNPCSYSQGDFSAQAPAGFYQPNNYPGNILQQGGPFTFPTPPDPVPMPTASSPVPSAACTAPAVGTCAVPGTYGAISLSGQGTLTLAPGVYNIYSLSTAGQAKITVYPPGAVVLNFPSTSASPINIAGQGIVNPTNIANNFQVNYSGTGAVSLAGNGSEYAILDAPKAAVDIGGNGDFFGRVVGYTINDHGNGKFHFDKNSALSPQTNNTYTLISYREISY